MRNKSIKEDWKESKLSEILRSLQEICKVNICLNQYNKKDTIFWLNEVPENVGILFFSSSSFPLENIEILYNYGGKHFCIQVEEIRLSSRKKKISPLKNKILELKGKNLKNTIACISGFKKEEISEDILVQKYIQYLNISREKSLNIVKKHCKDNESIQILPHRSQPLDESSYSFIEEHLIFDDFRGKLRSLFEKQYTFGVSSGIPPHFFKGKNK